MLSQSSKINYGMSHGSLPSGIYVNDVLEAVPIDKYFELFKPGDAHSGLGGFVRIAMKAVTTAPARRTGRVTTPGPNGGSYVDQTNGLLWVSGKDCRGFLAFCEQQFMMNSLILDDLDLCHRVLDQRSMKQCGTGMILASVAFTISGLGFSRNVHGFVTHHYPFHCLRCI